MGHPQALLAVTETLIRVLGKVSDWCDFLGINLNASKCQTIKVAGSRTMHPHSPPITIGDRVKKVLMTFIYWE